MRFILYARASTKDKQQPEHQIAELRAEAGRRAWEIAGEVIERESGRKDDRPEWQAALARVLRGQADGIAAVELSRFGRSTRHLLEVANLLRAHERHLVCTRQQIDTTTPIGRLLFTLLAALAEFEADLTQERVTAGVAFAKERLRKSGRTWGRQPEVVPPTTLRAARELQAAGLSLRRISARLFAVGHAQPARDRGRSAHPARPWPVPTLARALAAVQLPGGNGAPNPASGAG